ncbi:MAG: hypothetical protein HEP71_10605 [Roseivirga sp.]|nr:hypothetical protein [Roseivirga sp.]
MSQNHLDRLKEKFYEGKTSFEEEEELFGNIEDHIINAQQDFYEFSQSHELSQAFDDNLKIMLEKDRGKQIRLLWRQFSRAAAILLFGILTGVLYKDYQSADVSLLREELALVLSEQQSAHLRLKALELASELPQIEGEVLNTIGQMLGNDENVNVRLAAYRALSRSANKSAQVILMNSVLEQESFLIQSSIVKYLLSLSDPKIKIELLEIIENSSIEDGRKKRIENLITL